MNAVCIAWKDDICGWTVSLSAKEARRLFLSQQGPHGFKTWERAYAAGYRVRECRIVLENQA